MTERIYSDEAMRSIRRASYRAGAEGLSAYSVRGADGPEVVRCRDCAHWRAPDAVSDARCDGVFAFVKPDPGGFCAWGRRKDR